MAIEQIVSHLQVKIDAARAAGDLVGAQLLEQRLCNMEAAR